MAKFCGGGGGGHDDRARDADRAPGDVVVVRIGSAALAAWNWIRRRLIADCASLRLCGPTIGAAIFRCLDGPPGKCSSTVRAGSLVVHQRRNRPGLERIIWAGGGFAAAIAAPRFEIRQAASEFPIDLAN